MVIDVELVDAKRVLKDCDCHLNWIQEVDGERHSIIIFSKNETNDETLVAGYIGENLRNESVEIHFRYRGVTAMAIGSVTEIKLPADRINPPRPYDAYLYSPDILEVSLYVRGHEISDPFPENIRDLVFEGCLQ
ncbi:MAG TPA: hypothetical protein VGN72_01625 [Tepidisphaeraceae bacterium]|nr:hypothetical protein [Tepidisphaeraceae bacterium]